MKTSIKILSLLCLLFTVVSCSENDDPADNNLFVGTYEGSVSFHDSSSDISSENSSVTVVKVGSNYNFVFNEDGIPALKGVVFKKDGSHGVINVDFQEGLQVVRIDESTLYILYSKDGQSWTANCTR